jgi:vitamin B12/bleomycin/antimicrobial peptide transport system ATP-binding/permease protein
MIDTARRQIVRDAWRLAKPYWTSEEKWSAWGLLVAVIALNLGNVYISVRINAWNNAFYSSLQAFNSGELFRQLGTFCILVGFCHRNVCLCPLSQPDAADTLAAMADA